VGVSSGLRECEFVWTESSAVTCRVSTVDIGLVRTEQLEGWWKIVRNE